MRTDRHRIQIRLHCIIYRENSGLPVYNPNFRTRGGRSRVAGEDKYKMAASIRRLSTYPHGQMGRGFSKLCWLFSISGKSIVLIGSFRSNLLSYSSGSEQSRRLRTQVGGNNILRKLKLCQTVRSLSGGVPWTYVMLGVMPKFNRGGIQLHVWMSPGAHPINQYISHRARSGTTLSIYCLKSVLMASICPLKTAVKLLTSTHRL